MNIYMTIGRIFFGTAMLGIGILQIMYPGIRPILLPGLTYLPSHLSLVGHLAGPFLAGTGLLIAIGKKYQATSLIMGIVFLLLFLVGHLPFSLSSGAFNEYWVNTNKMLALAGGFLAVSTINASNSRGKVMQAFTTLGPLGKYLFAIMLYNFAVGHFNNLEGISNIVPEYIPFPSFWTFLGGVMLMGAAISIFSGYKTRGILLLLSLNLLIWLLTLHLYYSFLYPNWQDGENFIGSFTCLAFCGTALVISQTATRTNPGGVA